MGEAWGVWAAVASSGLGGTSIGATRYLVNTIDPLAIGCAHERQAQLRARGEHPLDRFLERIARPHRAEQSGEISSRHSLPAQVLT